MTRTEQKKDENYFSIIDKLNTYEIKQTKVYIRTKPSSYYPRGKFYNGRVRFVLKDLNKVSFCDDRDGIIDIYLSDIASPEDIQDSRRRD